MSLSFRHLSQRGVENAGRGAARIGRPPAECGRGADALATGGRERSGSGDLCSPQNLRIGLPRQPAMSAAAPRC